MQPLLLARRTRRRSTERRAGSRLDDFLLVRFVAMHGHQKSGQLQGCI